MQPEVMFVEASKDMNEIAKEDREWTNTYNTTQERYDAAARARGEELWQAVGSSLATHHSCLTSVGEPGRSKKCSRWGFAAR